MAVWQSRGNLYRAGFLGVIMGTLTFIIGFCAPSWAYYKDAWLPHPTQSMGLWQACTGDLSICTIAVDSDNPGWLKAVRALESMSMFFAVAACVVGLYCNCILKAQVSSNLFNKNMETSAVVSVIFGVFGLIVFATEASSFYDSHLGSLSWGFVLVCVSNTIMGISAFMMLISHRMQVTAAREYFSHRLFANSFQHHPQTPDYSQSVGDQVFITGPDGQMDFGPPAYETVVNCIPQETAPPPYSQVVKPNE